MNPSNPFRLRLFSRKGAKAQSFPESGNPDFWYNGVWVIAISLWRNAARFPGDFMFQLSREETANIQASRSQNATLNVASPRKTGVAPNWSQIATSSQRHRTPRFLLQPPPEPPPRRIGFRPDES